MQKTNVFFRISEKLNNLGTSIKCYWSLIKIDIYDNNRYVTDFKDKCHLFNSYFSEQCTILKNMNTLPCCRRIGKTEFYQLKCIVKQ